VTTIDPAVLAAIHHQCFTTAPRPWTEEEFAALLAFATTVLVALPGGFALGRVAGPEAELMTLAVRPDSRRKGIGRTLLSGFEHAAAARGVSEIYLEVAETNTAARALYAAAGYVSAGFRRDYYGRDGGRSLGALVLRKVLRPAGARPAAGESPTVAGDG